MRTLKEVCETDKSQCQITRELMRTLSGGIKNAAHVLNSYSRHCTVENYPKSKLSISHCERGDNWLDFNPEFETYSIHRQIIFKNDAILSGARSGTSIDHTIEKRFVVTIPAAIAFIGFLVTGVTAMFYGAVSISKAETKKVVAGEAAKCVIDKENALNNDITVVDRSTNLAKAQDMERFM